jgi:hypothetical protein
MLDKLIFPPERGSIRQILPSGTTKQGGRGACDVMLAGNDTARLLQWMKLGTNLISAYSSQKICLASFVLQLTLCASNDGGKSGNLSLPPQDKFLRRSRLPSSRRTHCFCSTAIRIAFIVETTLVRDTPSGMPICL